MPTRSSGRITIRTGDRDGWAWIEVEDYRSRCRARTRSQAVPAVLHDEAGRRGHRAWLVGELRHHSLAQRPHRLSPRCVRAARSSSSSCRSCPTTNCRNDTTHLLFRTVSPDLRRQGAERRYRCRPLARHARSNRVLSDVGRPAVRHRHARRRGRDRRDRSRGRHHRARRLRVPDSLARSSAARSTGRGASITCSSTPASTCCRRRSIDCLASAPKASTWASSRRRSIWPAKCPSRRSRRPKTMRIASSGRIGRSTIRFATAEEAAAMGMRKESARTGTLRLIDVQEYDLSACGGTHVERTGAIGVIAIGGCGEVQGRIARRIPVRRPRAAAVPGLAGALSAVQKHLSVPPIEMAASIERMQEDAKAVQRNVRGFQEKLAAHEAHALLAKGSPVIRSDRGLGCAGDQGDRRCDHRGGSTCSGRVVHHRDAGASRDRARRIIDDRCGRDVEAAGGEVWREGRREA